MLGFDIQIYLADNSEDMIFNYEDFDILWLRELVEEKKATTEPSNGYPEKYYLQVNDAIKKLENYLPNNNQTIVSDNKISSNTFPMQGNLLERLKQLSGNESLYIEAWDLS